MPAAAQKSRPRKAVSHATPKPLSSARSPALSGKIRVPGDKSISHRALMFGAIATRRTTITGLLEAEDVLNTAKALQALGCPIRKIGDTWEVLGRGVGGLAQPDGDLDFGNSGTGTRLMMGLIAGHDMTVRMTGDASLSKRPMARVLDPLKRMGVEVLDGAVRLPLSLRGTADLVPIEYRLPVPSAQLKSAILIAGLHATGATTVIEAEATRDHTERMLRHFGAEVVAVERDGARAITVTGDGELEGRAVMVPGDPSSAAFLAAAALIVPGSEITIEGVLVNPTRTGFYTTLREMGADVAFLNEREEGGEPIADVRVRHSKLSGRAGAAGARAEHDRRIPDAGLSRRLCERRDAHGGSGRAEGQGERPAGRNGGRADRQRRGGQGRRRHADRARWWWRARRRAGRHPPRPSHRHGLPDARPRRRPARHGRRHRHDRHQLPRVPIADGGIGGNLHGTRRARMMPMAALMIIAIDGPAASGKGTLAQRIARTSASPISTPACCTAPSPVT